MLEFDDGHIHITRGAESRQIDKVTERNLYYRIGKRIHRERSLATIIELYSTVDGDGTPEQLARAVVIYRRESERAKRLIARTLREPLSAPKTHAMPLTFAA
jgi:hypothetical protein